MVSMAQLQHGIDRELVEEKGTSLARAGERLEAALTALRRLDGCSSDEQREALHEEAGAALHSLIIQRDAIGPTRHDQIFQIFAVPPAVIARLGVIRGGR